MENPSYKLNLPPKMLKRGRPKGLGTTVVGLPRKKKSTRPIPLLKKTPVEKEKGKHAFTVYKTVCTLLCIFCL
jgi:formate hydrogenlyase subunit 6/NADH:ubiquinone oxidoreductase subunit I